MKQITMGDNRTKLFQVLGHEDTRITMYKLVDDKKVKLPEDTFRDVNGTLVREFTFEEKEYDDTYYDETTIRCERYYHKSFTLSVDTSVKSTINQHTNETTKEETTIELSIEEPRDDKEQSKNVAKLMRELKNKYKTTVNLDYIPNNVKLLNQILSNTHSLIVEYPLSNLLSKVKLPDNLILVIRNNSEDSSLDKLQFKTVQFKAYDENDFSGLYQLITRLISDKGVTFSFDDSIVIKLQNVNNRIVCHYSVEEMQPYNEVELMVESLLNLSDDIHIHFKSTEIEVEDLSYLEPTDDQLSGKPITKSIASRIRSLKFTTENDDTLFVEIE